MLGLQLRLAGRGQQGGWKIHPAEGVRSSHRLARPPAAHSKAAKPIWPRRSELVTSFDKELNELYNSFPGSLLALLSWALG